MQSSTFSVALLAEVDPVAVRRMLDNLLVNALQYTQATSVITVSAEIPTDSAEASVPTMLVLSVRDTGPGFPADFLPHAFDRFTRADQSRTRAHSRAGSGLGLAIVDTLARAHGGTATAENSATGGAVVTIYLPVTARSANDT